MSVVSYRKTLQTEIVDFLKNDKSENRLFLQDIIPTIVSQLLFYREEGRFLYPEVYLINELKTLQVLPYLQKHKIADGEANAITVSKAIKKCAPLCENTWSIYLLVSKNRIEYGIFAGEETLTSVHREDSMLSNSEDAPMAICIRVLSGHSYAK